MFSKPGNKPCGKIDSLIGIGTVIEGNIFFSGGLRIDGEVKGSVCATGDQPSTLVVSEHARIDGEVNVANLFINGTVIGPVRSGEFIELQPKARVTGDVQYSAIEIQLGAIVQGKLIHFAGENGTKSVELKLASSH